MSEIAHRQAHQSKLAHYPLLVRLDSVRAPGGDSSLVQSAALEVFLMFWQETRKRLARRYAHSRTTSRVEVLTISLSQTKPRVEIREIIQDNLENRTLLIP